MTKTPHYMGHRRRLRERFILTGRKGFEDYELLELILTYAIPRRDVKPVAKRLLARFKTLKGVLDSDSAGLAQVEGIGSQTGTLLSVLRGVMQRYHELQAVETDLLNSPEAVLAYCRSTLEAEKNEVFDVLYVSTQNRLIRSERLAEGTIDRAAVYPRRVIEGALTAHAASLIFVHNHPSGDPTPSPEDRALTDALAEAARAVDIAVLDHIVIGGGRHFSFRAQGWLSPRRMKNP
ncbi:MAG: DNA repair protein RadC [Elusimicrobia bacterium]|nr:DNA repair protein RadC [Elusimicrobiota bacterium]